MTYIGETINLVARITAHNRGSGAFTTTDPSFRPWCVLAYVCGFEGCPRAGRQYFERLWQAQRDQSIHRSREPMGPDAIADTAMVLIANQSYRNCPILEWSTLVFVRCGSVSIPVPEARASTLSII
jgi:predicted GIY-YIG superfamily endonuclease